MTATQSDGIKQMQNGDPIWERIRSETREAAAAEPILASFLHATILNQMGLDHEQLTYRYSGRDYRLTDVHGKVVKDVIA